MWWCAHYAPVIPQVRVMTMIGDDDDDDDDDDNFEDNDDDDDS